MNNRMALKQARKSFDAIINESPTDITINRASLVDNGFGKLIPDPSGATAESVFFTVRIAHERSQPGDFRDSPVGMGDTMEKMIQFRHTDDIRQGDYFNAQGVKYKVGYVDPLVKFGGIIGYQASLIKVSP